MGSSGGGGSSKKKAAVPVNQFQPVVTAGTSTGGASGLGGAVGSLTEGTNDAARVALAKAIAERQYGSSWGGHESGRAGYGSTGYGRA